MALLESDFLKRAALDAGFDICGLARVHGLDEERGFLEQWLTAGFDGGMAYMHRNLDKRLSPELLAEGAKTVIVCGVSYLNDTSSGYGTGSGASHCSSTVSDHSPAVYGRISPGPDAYFGTPRVASYARAADYHDTIRGMLRNLAETLESEYGSFSWRAFCDSAPVLEKRWAVEAGLGWQGRNSLIINPEIGSFFLLGELLIGIEADIYDTPYSGSGCGECRRCIEHCPNGAIISGGAENQAISRCIDARRCIARATIEKLDTCGDAAICGKGNAGKDSAENIKIEIKQDCSEKITVPDAAAGTGPKKNHLADWIFGCDECQSVCPYNMKAPRYRNPAFTPLFDPRQLDREFWLSLSEDEFNEKFGRTPLSRAGLARIKSNLEIES